MHATMWRHTARVYNLVSDMYQTSEWSAVPILILLQAINI